MPKITAVAGNLAIVAILSMFLCGIGMAYAKIAGADYVIGGSMSAMFAFLQIEGKNERKNQ